MQNIFSYESKFMQMLLKLADYMILNLLFVVCSIPVFTIGAAQAGLYTGLKVLQDKEDDSSCLKAFFRGFKAGFGTVTLVWGIVSLVIVAVSYTVILVYGFKYWEVAGSTVPFWMGITAMAIGMIFQSMVPLFHSAFACTASQLARNAFLVIMANPLRSIFVALFNWAPVIIAAVHFPIFMQMSFVLLVLYYSVCLGFSFRLMAKPFQRLRSQFMEQPQQTNE